MRAATLHVQCLAVLFNDKDGDKTIYYILQKVRARRSDDALVVVALRRARGVMRWVPEYPCSSHVLRRLVNKLERKLKGKKPHIY